MQDETRISWVLGFAASYIRDFTVVFLTAPRVVFLTAPRAVWHAQYTGRDGRSLTSPEATIYLKWQPTNHSIVHQRWMDPENWLPEAICRYVRRYRRCLALVVLYVSQDMQKESGKFPVIPQNWDGAVSELGFKHVDLFLYRITLSMYKIKFTTAVF